jgi:dihydrofolate reductase
LQFFKKRTLGSVVIMGKNTYLSLPYKPLWGRENFVVSTTLKDDKVKIFPNLSDAIAEAIQTKKRVFLIWWKRIYEEGIKFANEIFFTKVFWIFNCDVFLKKDFFSFIEKRFHLVDKSNLYVENGIRFQIFHYKKFSKTKSLGYFHEKLVQDFLISKWWKLIASNFNIRGWEIDLIFENEWVIHFIEVKTNIWDFQDYLTLKKINALKKAAKAWIYKKWNNFNYQFDLAIVDKTTWNIEFVENFLN